MCIVAPMGAGGLEGFMEGEKYRYTFVQPSNSREPSYARVYHRLEGDEEEYYEICGMGTFKMHFKVLGE